MFNENIKYANHLCQDIFERSDTAHIYKPDKDIIIHLV